MRVPIAWLRDYVDLPDDSQAIADRLAMLGFPVAEIVRRPAITGVVTGRIDTLEKHPNADRLQVGTIDIGAERRLTIATAATNVAVGQKIAVATIGARLPHLTIAPRTMRGIASEGMMCSADELALPADWFEDGILLLDSDTPIGLDAAAHFRLGDDVLDVEITTNRADAMCVLGIARELAGAYGTPLRLPSFANPGDEVAPSEADPDVTLASPDVRRFVAQRFEGLHVATAPTWMRVRLALAGQRPIDSVVDISNYVMLEVGQPLHCYDAAKIDATKLVVRDAREGERLVTLDGVERKLSPQALVIADDRAALCAAGVMGGLSSEVGAATRAIVLEAANFSGARVRRTAAELGLRSEASSRHEKALAPQLTDIGAARAATLLRDLGAVVGRPRAFGDALPTMPVIPLPLRDVERLLGLRLPIERIVTHLEAVGCSVVNVGERLDATPPAWRTDLHLAADLVEEVGRMEGYDAIEAVVPSVPAHAISSAAFECESAVSHALAALGYREIISHTLHGAKFFDVMRHAAMIPSHTSVEVRNPLSEEQRYLRYSLGPNLIEYLARYQEPLRVFELGHTFAFDDGHIAETSNLTFGFSAKPHDGPAWSDEHVLRLKGDAEALIRAVSGVRVEAEADKRNGLHPGKCVVLFFEGHEVATLGQLDPRLTKAYDSALPIYLCDIYVDALPEYRLPRYVAPSRFPATWRDLALVVGLDVTAAQIERTIARTLGDLCTNVRVFDEYRGPQVGADRKSIAVRVTLQRFDATITDEEGDAAIVRVRAALLDELAAAIRT